MYGSSECLSTENWKFSASLGTSNQLIRTDENLKNQFSMSLQFGRSWNVRLRIIKSPKHRCFRLLAFPLTSPANSVVTGFDLCFSLERSEKTEGRKLHALQVMKKKAVGMRKLHRSVMRDGASRQRKSESIDYLLLSPPGSDPSKRLMLMIPP